jgi:tetratricopeptide (TPR) repeat protein
MPMLNGMYHQYLTEQDTAGFKARVSERYGVATLERLSASGDRMARRAAVLALGLLADYDSNATLGRALTDHDRGVRILAENAIGIVWCRVGNRRQQHRLAVIVELNATHRYQEAIERSTRLIDEAPLLAEGWNQRAVAYFNTGRFSESIRDCDQTLELNPYHFGAAAGMGQCYVQLNQRARALACFRRALGLNRNMEGVRAHVLYLERVLKSQD